MSLTLAQVLDRREERREEQAAMLARTGCPLVQLTLVSPGSVKSSPAIDRVFESARTALSGALAGSGWPTGPVSLHRLVTGPELLVAVDAEALRLKALLVDLEDAHPQGRLWDLDVITTAGPVGRASLGRPPRGCLVCPRPAHECTRSQRHSLDEVLTAWAVLAGRQDLRSRA